MKHLHCRVLLVGFLLSVLGCAEAHRNAAIEAADRCVDALLAAPNLEDAGFPPGLRNATLSGYDVDTLGGVTSVYYSVRGLAGTSGFYVYFDRNDAIVPPTKASAFQVHRLQLMGKVTSLVDVEVDDCSLSEFSAQLGTLSN